MQQSKNQCNDILMHSCVLVKKMFYVMHKIYDSIGDNNTWKDLVQYGNSLDFKLRMSSLSGNGHKYLIFNLILRSYIILSYFKAVMYHCIMMPLAWCIDALVSCVIPSPVPWSFDYHLRTNPITCHYGALILLCFLTSYVTPKRPPHFNTMTRPTVGYHLYIGEEMHVVVKLVRNCSLFNCNCMCEAPTHLLACSFKRHSYVSCYRFFDDWCEDHQTI